MKNSEINHILLPFLIIRCQLFFNQKTAKLPHFFCAKVNVEDDIYYISLDSND